MAVFSLSCAWQKNIICPTCAKAKYLYSQEQMLCSFHPSQVSFPTLFIIPFVWSLCRLFSRVARFHSQALITRDIKETFTNNLIFMIICFWEFITFCIDSLIICHYFLLFSKTFKSYGISYFIWSKQ